MSETAWEAVWSTYRIIRRIYPSATKPTAPSLAPLVDLPAVRSLRSKEGSQCKSEFTVAASKGNRNIQAALLQVAGAVKKQECVRCRGNRGLWDACVAKGGEGPCANCIFNGQANRCRGENNHLSEDL